MTTNWNDLLGQKASGAAYNSAIDCKHNVEVEVVEVDSTRGAVLVRAADVFCSQDLGHADQAWVAPIGDPDDYDDDAQLEDFAWSGATEEGNVELELDF